MSEQPTNRTTADWLVELCVYAPIGFALDAHKYVPEFVERGRNQVALARFLGKFAVDRLEKQFGPLGTLLRAAAPADGSGPGSAGTTAAESPDPTPAPSATERNGSASGAGSTPAPATKRAAKGPADAPKTTAPKTTAPKTTAPKTTAPKTTAPKATRKASARRAAASSAPAGANQGMPAESDLAIAGYATLAASQIVPRLTTLESVDLDAIGRFERANRGRRTILNRVDQLLAER